MLSCQDLDENIDTTLISVHWIYSYGQEMVSSALHKDWEQGETASSALSKGKTKSVYQHVWSSLIDTLNVVCLIRMKT